MPMRTLPWVALLIAGCGGTVSGPDDRDTGPTTQTDSGRASETGLETESEFKDVPLGQCDEGFDPREDRSSPCNWLGDDARCYDTREAACNCICPRDHDSVCSSGFFRGEGEATPVHCL